MRSYENAISSRLGRSERSKAIPETISLLNQEKIWPGRRWSRKKKWNKNVPNEYRHYLSKKSPFHQVFEVTSLCLRGTLQRREKKRMVRHEVRSTIKIHHYIRLVCESRAKIPSSDPKTSLTTRRLLFFEAIETIVWKLQIVLAFRIVSKFFESGTIIWKPGLK